MWRGSALSTVLLHTTNRHSGLYKKTIWFIVKFVQTRWTLLLVVSAGIRALNQGKETWQQSQASWLLCPFFLHLLVILITSERRDCRLSQTSCWSISSIDWFDQASFLACYRCASFALTFEVFIVHRDLHRGRTCHGLLQLSLHSNLLVCKPPRDRIRWLFVRPSSQSIGSLASIVAIGTPVRNRDQDSSPCDRRHHRTCSFVPTRCSSQLDGAVGCCIASRRALRLKRKDRVAGSVQALSCDKPITTLRAQLGISRYVASWRWRMEAETKWRPLSRGLADRDFFWRHGMFLGNYPELRGAVHMGVLLLMRRIRVRWVWNLRRERTRRKTQMSAKSEKHNLNPHCYYCSKIYGSRS